ncbi:hypothetical protein [Methylobacterium aquaticum]|uniref:hypothetical protein n=1 Tax=Methylobacterium aquaticum TaxID=270351 RepID=UPI0019349635|nr:hypothetical protein [Methylobacterium aquaticum]
MMLDLIADSSGFSSCRSVFFCFALAGHSGGEAHLLPQVAHGDCADLARHLGFDPGCAHGLGRCCLLDPGRYPIFSEALCGHPALECHPLAQALYGSSVHGELIGDAGARVVLSARLGAPPGCGSACALHPSQVVLKAPQGFSECIEYVLSVPLDVDANFDFFFVIHLDVRMRFRPDRRPRRMLFREFCGLNHPRRSAKSKKIISTATALGEDWLFGSAGAFVTRDVCRQPARLYHKKAIPAYLSVFISTEIRLWNDFRQD